MKTPKIPNTIIANEILNLLDSTVLSSESKNNVLVDYLDQAHYQGFNDGKKELIAEMFSVAKDTSIKVVLRSLVKKLLILRDEPFELSDLKIK